MKEYYGNYLGICIDNQDPEHRGRCQIFIPHIMPLLYENWNKEGKDITLECVGNNIPSGLNSDIIDKLKKVLPWAEAALPVIGNSTSGSYNSITGNFNQTSSPESLIFNQGAAAVDATGKSGADFIFNSEKQVDANGNLKVYYMPGNDGGGRFEIAGINERYHRNEANALKSLIDQGQYQQAEARAKAYIMQYTNTVSPISNGNAGIEYALRDIAFNRGQGGCNWVAKYAAGATPLGLKTPTTEQRKIILEAQNRDPIGFLNKLRAASEAYERDKVGYRANFWKGLTKRWNDRLSNSLALAASGGSAPVNNPASTPDASALPPTPSPFAGSDGSPQASTDNPFDTPVTLVDTSNATAPPAGVSLDTPVSLSQPTAPTAQPSQPLGGIGNFNWRQAIRAWGRDRQPGSDGVIRSPKNPKITLCLRGAWNVAGYITNNLAMAGNGGVVSAKNTSELIANFNSKAKGYWAYAGKISSGYQPQQGDFINHQYQPHGHAQIFVDGKFHAHREGDAPPQSYFGKRGYTGSNYWRLTAAGQEAVKRANRCNVSQLGQPFSGSIATGGSADETFGDPGTANVLNPTSTITSPMDTTGLPQGLFAHPAPGAMLWVFFREGNPMYPVYFAASYGQAEWQSMQKASSTPLYDAQNGGSEINSESHFRPNNAGTLMFRGSVTAGKDNRAVRLAHASGGYFELLPTGSVHYSPNEHVSHIAGNGYNYCLNREEWTQGDENRVTIGNQRIVVGNPSQSNIDAIEQLTEKVKSINQKMLEPSQQSNQAPA
jgi:hypothetical protein